MRSPPIEIPPDCYYWYYATQVMHNVPGPEWDRWNRQMRRVLIETQEHERPRCGSWKSQRAEARSLGTYCLLMQTSLSCLTLEVYYRYLPLYKLGQFVEISAAATPPATASAEPPKGADQPKKE